MRLPRRHPRAVYEVYDAEERLGEQEQERAEGDLAHDLGETLAGPAPTVERRSPHGAPRRMLAGALLCTAAVCAFAAIAVALLHAISGAGASHRLVARVPPTPRAAGGELVRGARLGAARASKRAHDTPVLTEPPRSVVLQKRAALALRATRSPVAASAVPRRGEAPRARCSSSCTGVATSASRYALALAASGEAPAVQAPSTSTAAEVEFGFER